MARTGVRRISADIGLANDGESILGGVADNLTDRTRVLLARFFDKPLSYFYPPDITGTPTGGRSRPRR